MINIKLAIKYFALAYLIGTVTGFITFYINETLMWISMFSIMPVVFGYFFYSYLKNAPCNASILFRETNILILFWITTSFLLDGLVYIVIVPIVFGNKSNWTFFLDQSPWIWFNYCTIILLGHISRLILKRRLNK